MKHRFAASIAAIVFAFPGVAAAASTQSFASLWLSSNADAQSVITGGAIDGFIYGYVRGARKFVVSRSEIPLQHATFSRGIAYYRNALETYYAGNPLSRQSAGTLVGCLADAPSYTCTQFHMAEPAPLVRSAPTAVPAVAPSYVNPSAAANDAINRAAQWAGWTADRRAAFVVGALYGYGNGFTTAQSALAPAKEFTDPQGAAFSKTPVAYISIIDAYYQRHPQSHATAISIAVCAAGTSRDSCDDLDKL